MNDAEEIRKLQEEVLALRAQLEEQAAKVWEMQVRLRKLTGQASPAMKQPSAKFSLENFIGLRLIQFIGIIVLVIGLSIGVKYAIDRELISESLRILLAYGAGIVLYLLSVRLKKAYTLFSALLFSGGMASLYFTTYAAFVYYGMFPFAVAFAVMIGLTVYTAFEAIRYNRQEIVLLGLIGAYAIPFLISQNNDRADLFFLYISLINLAVVFLSVQKDWRLTGRLAQVLTWILFIGWASDRFQPENLAMGIAFMSYFFLLFGICIFSYRIIHKTPLTESDSYQLVLNNLGLYLSMLFLFGNIDQTQSLAGLTLVMCAITAVQAIGMRYYFDKDDHAVRMMASFSLMLFVFFIGMKWNGITVTLLWLLTAVIVFLWGFRIRSVPARMAAIVLIGATLFKLVALDSILFSTVQKVIAYLVLGALLLIVSFFYQRFRKQIFGEREGED
jgi:uncharacterized membrane protein